MSRAAGEIVRIARSKVGSHDWRYDKKKDEFAENTNKCNKFIYDVLVEAGVTPPQVPKSFLIFLWGSRLPTAGEWANASNSITGWSVVTDPQPGDIAAVKSFYLDATGHVGIVVSKNETVSASSHVGGVIVQNDWGFRANEARPTFRRYTQEAPPPAPEQNAPGPSNSYDGGLPPGGT